MQESKYKRCSYINLIFWLFLGVFVITRTVLLIKSVDALDISLIEILKIYLIGAFYDFVSVSYLTVPFVIYLIFLPKRFFNHALNRYITYVFTFIIIFGAVFLVFSEWFFWNEFSVRFNFIAVDYLVYTKEVIGNIKESYPMGILIIIISFISTFVFYIIYKTQHIENFLQNQSRLKDRFKSSIIYLIIPVIFFVGVTQEFAKISTNQYNNELSKSGLYSLFAAFRNNTLDYDKFYITDKDESVIANLKKVIDANSSAFLNSNDVTREIVNAGVEKDYNIVMIVVESLSGKFLESLGGKKGLTPNLDSLAQKSLFFTNFYATGTRTVRAMEAITLSLPPTPGRSIVKRPDNHNMYSSGFILKNKGYDTKFIYGGHGYFDNMNEFFSTNGFSVLDRSDFSKEEDTFHTIWGVCDEDLLNKSLKEADLSYKEHKPFMSFIMTTSNHRPYDYPDGRIDIPSHTGREGAVKYTDYSIGEFIGKAKIKPWFKNTIFVIVADHCSSSAGKTEVPLDKYHIPMIVYAPEILKPQVISKISSQIDIMPTLFGILNWSYKSKFYGKDILSSSFTQRALMGTYQKLGLYKENKLIVLSPTKKIKSYEVVKQDIYDTKYKEISTQKNLKIEAISYYQGASALHKKGLDRYESQ
ncbi:MAG: sulfatase-like hydrolase/transferase [Sulfurimonas sp.]|uniref:LTA synthase family protein n=1 Tax=Sulfurimonas sp. TaxID=2022749 RepID=UPI0025D87AE2|nr:alkaline phosphatase family protein [Sulfurimonas sp.]MCK9492095.1 sulfatase-like hydrolase/transferase [Sulfurimonas sp.]